MTKIIKISTLVLVAILSLTCCNREDDIDEIFDGKIWYMNGGIINGMKLNSEVKNFYTDAGASAYFIQFSGNQFQGCLSSGVTFNGTWSANGKNHTIALKMANKPNGGTTFDKQIYNILSSASSYESGADFLFIKEDASNTIYFTNSRNKVYN